MSQLQLSDLEGKSIGYSNNSSMFNKLQNFLNELEEKEQDLYDQHNRLVSDFQRTKSTIFQLTNKTETIGEKSKRLSKSVTLKTTSENDIESKIAEFTQLNNEIDIKIMNTDIQALEHESNIIQIRSQKLSLKKTLSNLQNQKNELTFDFQEEMNHFKKLMDNCADMHNSMNNLAILFKSKQEDCQKSIQELKLHSHLLTQHIQNAQIQKCNKINNIKDRKSQLYQLSENFSKRKKKNEIKQMQMSQKYKKDIEQIKNVMELIKNTINELKIQENQIRNALNNEHDLKDELTIIENKILAEQKISVQIDFGNQECEKMEQEQRKCEFQTHQNLYKYLNYLNHQIKIAQPQGCQESLPNDEILYDFSNDEDDEKVKEYSKQKDAIKKKEKELNEVRVEIRQLQQNIESAKKSILESSIQYSELEEKAAKLLRSSVKKQKSILLQQEQRLIDHEDFITQTLVRIQNIRAKIVLHQSKIESTTTYNQVTSKMLNHVVTCCSSKLYKDEFIFLPDNYVFLSQ